MSMSIKAIGIFFEKHRELLAHARASACVAAPLPLCWRIWEGWQAGELPGDVALGFGGLLLICGIAMAVLQITASKTFTAANNVESGFDHDSSSGR